MSTPHGFMPGVIVKNIAPGSSDPAIDPCGVIQHVAVSNAESLFGLFSNDGGIESHFYIRKDGTIEQYRSIYFEADAQFAGNSFGSPRKGFVSVEHEGGVGADLNQPMPQAQLDAFHRVVLWVHSQRPFPLRVCPAWNAEGVGYHAMFDQWNTNHHSCPGAGRIKQFNEVTVPWLKHALDPTPKPPAAVNYEDGHQSGRFDASTSRGKTMLARLADRCTVFAVTEADLLHAPAGYRAHGSESKVMWKMADWHRLDSGVVNIPTPTWKRGRSSRATVDVYWVLLRNRKTQRTLLRMVGHLPAHLFRSAQRQANLAALAALGGVVADLDKRLTPDAKTASFDLNRNLARQSERGVVAQAFAKTGLQLVVPPKATHGLLAKIDGLLSTDPDGSVVMFRRFPGFDHRGFRKASVA